MPDGHRVLRVAGGLYPDHYRLLPARASRCLRRPVRRLVAIPGGSGQLWSVRQPVHGRQNLQGRRCRGGRRPRPICRRPLCGSRWGSIVCAGTFRTNAVISKDLNLIGAGIGDTALDGGRADSVLVIQANAQAAMQDLTITKGRAATGGGINNAGTLTLKEIGVTDNIGGSGRGHPQRHHWHDAPGGLPRARERCRRRRNPAGRGDVELRQADDGRDHGG